MIQLHCKIKLKAQRANQDQNNKYNKTIQNKLLIIKKRKSKTLSKKNKTLAIEIIILKEIINKIYRETLMKMRMRIEYLNISKVIYNLSKNTIQVDNNLKSMINLQMKVMMSDKLQISQTKKTTKLNNNNKNNNYNKINIVKEMRYHLMIIVATISHIKPSLSD